jgi:protocatechuate 3,4-dioxygenase beta subunit
VLAREKHASTSYEFRTVEGTVLNASGTPVRAAIVYLYDDRTGVVRSFITDRTGHYRFSSPLGLDDYQIHAKEAGWVSKEARISKFDDRTDFSINLRTSRRDHK